MKRLTSNSVHALCLLVYPEQLRSITFSIPSRRVSPLLECIHSTDTFEFGCGRKMPMRPLLRLSAVISTRDGDVKLASGRSAACSG